MHYLKHSSLGPRELQPRGCFPHDDSATPCPSSEWACVTARQSRLLLLLLILYLSDFWCRWNYSLLMCHQQERESNQWQVGLMCELCSIYFKMRKIHTVELHWHLIICRLISGSKVSLKIFKRKKNDYIFTHFCFMFSFSWYFFTASTKVLDEVLE